jgi:hypothetical protein
LATEVLAVSGFVTEPNVPAGHTYVIRDVETRQEPGANNEVIIRDLSRLNAIILSVEAAAGHGRSWLGHIVLPEGTSWQVQALGAAAHVTVSGYDLLAAPT